MAEAKGSFDYGGGGGGGAKRDGAKSGSGSGEAKDAPSVTGGGGSAVAEAKGDQTSASPSVTVHDLVITPEDGPLCGPLELEIDYALDAPLDEAQWVFQYLVDSARARHIIELGVSPSERHTMPAGPSSTLFSVDAVDVGGIAPGRLTQCGLLTARLESRGKAVLDINMVVFVREEQGGFIRQIISPLEDE